MKKRVLSWLLAISMTVGVLIPSMNVYAAEDVTEGVVAASQEVSSTEEDEEIVEEAPKSEEQTESSEEAKELTTEETEQTEPAKEPAAGETEQASAEGSSSAETSEEAAQQEVTSEESADEATEGLTGDVDAKEELADAASIELTEVEELTETEELELEELEEIDESLGTASLMSVGVQDTKEAVTVDPDIRENKVGFIYHADPSNPEQMIGPGVTIESTRKDIKVEIYASQKPNRTGAIKIGTKDNIEKWVSEYNGKTLQALLEAYYTSNTVPVDFSSLAKGTWYIFGRFYTGEGKKGYVESDAIVLYNNADVPVISSIENVSAKDVKDGKVVFEKPAGREKLYFGEYGGKTLSTATVVGDTFVADNLAPGRYVAYYGATEDVWFESGFYAPSQTAEFFVDVEKIIPSGIVPVYYATGESVYNGAAINKGDTVRIVGIVSPADAYDTGVTYTSSDPKIASIDSLGNVKGIKAGTVTITIATTAKGSIDTPLVRTVFDLTVIDEARPKIKTAKFKQNVVTVDYRDNGEVELALTFDKLSDPVDISWTVDDTSKAAFSEYETEAEDGVAENTLLLKAPGKVVVSANIEGSKVISCTVNIEGTEGETSYYFYKGKIVTGFCALDMETYKVIATGNAAFKAQNAKIKYYEAQGGRPVTGVYQIGKKLYGFDENCNLIRGEQDKKLSVINGYVVNQLGEIQTGWAKADEETVEHYYDPANGEMVVSSWVPRGKGFTWVNAEGLMLDDNGKSFSEDGLHEMDATYFFKGGLRQTGFIYFDADKNVVAAKKAAYAMYFQAPTGGALKGEFLWVNGKEYYADADGKITISGRFSVTNDKNKTDYYYADATGAIVMGPKIVTANGSSFYVNEDGTIVFGKFIKYNSKVYFCDQDGKIGTELDYVISTYYCDNAEGGRDQLYLKLANAKNPSAGTFFYRDKECKVKVTNAKLYPSKTTNKYMYLDKSGKLVSGFAKIDGKTYFFNQETYEISTSSKNHVIVYKGNKYIIYPDGSLCTDTTGFIEAEAWPENKKYLGGNNVYRVKNSSGVLMTGVQTIKGKKYVFGPEGNLYYPLSSGLIESNDTRAYLGGYDEAGMPCVYAPGKAMVLAYKGTAYIINNDGSVLQNGWATVDGKKYYVFAGRAVPGGGICKIGGKYYTFNQDCSMHTGWIKLSNTNVLDFSNYSTTRFSGDHYFFFNQKTGAMEIGWRTMNTIKTDSLGNVLDGDESLGNGSKKKIYFNAAATADCPVGALVCNKDMTISGKIYRFGPDGSVESGNEALVYSGPTTESYVGFDSYRKADGTMARGRTLVKTSSGSYYCYFGLADGKKETNVIRKTGNKWYYYGENGVMSTSLKVDLLGCKKDAIAIFNRDGSIKNFVFADGANTVVKNDSFYIVNGHDTNSMYVLGNNGLPKTGLTNITTTGAYIYTEADGRTMITDSEVGVQLLKIGSKYYMFNGGLLLSKNSGSEFDSTGGVDFDASANAYVIRAYRGTFAKLPAADRAAAIKYFEYAEHMGKSYVTVLVNPDGTVRAADYKLNGEKGKILSVSTNKYGIVKDELSMFVKKGSWKISPYYSEGKNSRVEVEAISVKNLSSNGLTLVVSWDSNGNLCPITCKETGKVVTGDYMINYYSESMIVSIRNGRLSAGTIKLSAPGVTMTVRIDPDLGIGYEPF